MLGIHCNRCGRSTSDILLEAPPPGYSPAGSPLGGGEEQLAPGFLVCADCYGLGGPYRFCARCGQETESTELQGGYCDWCRAADEIPFEEPADDAWWESKTPGASPPSWWPRV